MSAEKHRRTAQQCVRCGVLTISDTRIVETDRGGALVAELLTVGGHQVEDRQIVPDEPAQMSSIVRRWVDNDTIDAVLITGGTGISSRDRTYETISSMMTKSIPGYGELFRTLSYEEIGAAAMLSRAVGGVCGQTIVLTMPGSTAAVQLAMEKLIVPELAHLVHEATKTT